MKEINIPKHFSNVPAGRYRRHGKFSGERFRQEFLAPALRAQPLQIVTVRPDGVRMFGSSFVDEAFGGLVREEGFSEEELRSRLVIETALLPRERYIWDRIEVASRQVQQQSAALEG